MGYLKNKNRLRHEPSGFVNSNDNNNNATQKYRYMIDKTQTKDKKKGLDRKQNPS